MKIIGLNRTLTALKVLCYITGLRFQMGTLSQHCVLVNMTICLSPDSPRPLVFQLLSLIKHCVWVVFIDIQQTKALLYCVNSSFNGISIWKLQTHHKGLCTFLDKYWLRKFKLCMSLAQLFCVHFLSNSCVGETH